MRVKTSTSIDAEALTDAISAIAGERDEAFPHECAVRLFQFQTWMFTPVGAREYVEAAGILAAAHLLEDMGRKAHQSKSTLLPSDRLIRLLKKSSYRDLYDFVIGDYGSWTDLARTPSPAQFDQTLKGYVQDARTTARLIEYQFRYLDHGGTDEQMANLSHAMFFLYKDSDSVSGKTLKNRWRDHKHSSVFLYVSEVLGVDFHPPSVQSANFTELMIAAAKDQKRIRTFFETSAYVASKIAQVHQAFGVQGSLMIWPKKKRPKTAQLGDELHRMVDYASESIEIR